MNKKTRYLLNIRPKYRLDFDNLIVKLKTLGFEPDRVLPRYCIIIGSCFSNNIEKVKQLPEVQKSKIEPHTHQEYINTCKHTKIHSGECSQKKGYLSRHYIWVCSECGQLEFDLIIDGEPNGEPELFHQTIKKFMREY